MNKYDVQYSSTWLGDKKSHKSRDGENVRFTDKMRQGKEIESKRKVTNWIYINKNTLQHGIITFYCNSVIENDHIQHGFQYWYKMLNLFLTSFLKVLNYIISPRNCFFYLQLSLTEFQVTGEII